MNADWAAFLRDKHDVKALIDYISEAASQPDFVAKAHAPADKVRDQQPLRGRPPKVCSIAMPPLSRVDLK